MNFRNFFQKSGISRFMIVIGVTIAAIQLLQAAPTDPSRRTVTSLNIGWKFFYGEPGGTPQSVSFNDASWTDVCIPHTLRISTSHLDGTTDCGTQATFHRTTGWYRKHLTIPTTEQGKKIFLDFQGVMQVATVYVNGTQVGIHEVSGFDEFHFDITSYVIFSGDNVIAVHVDNRMNSRTPPDDTGKNCATWCNNMDFILFGGFYRDVKLVCTDNLHVSFPWEALNCGVFVTTPAVSAGSATVNVKVGVKNDNATAKNVTVATTILDANNVTVGTATSVAQNINASASALFNLTINVSSPRLWTPNTPSLYKVHNSIGDGAAAVDSVWTRIGIRSVEFNATSGFILNGQPLKLIGVNRHTAWPFIGEAVPNTCHYREAKQIKSFGFNWVRLSHYPHDPEFLDALDELGIFALEEGPTWCHTGADPAWRTNLESAFRHMIRRDRNHPCIIIWNASINHQGCDATLHAAAHQEDSSHYAGRCTSTGLGVDCPMCFNSYPGVAVATGGAVCIEHTGHLFPTSRSQGESRMITHAQWHWAITNLSRATASNSGIAAWAMYDYNSDYNSGVNGGNTDPERNIVFHGQFDLYRIPKFSAFWYQAELTATPMVFIANYWASGSPTNPVTVFSNCDTVELIVNGTSRGRQGPLRNTETNSLLHPPFQFANVTYAAGTLTANGYSGGLLRATQTVRTPGAAAGLRIETDTDTLLADGVDLARIIVSVVDANGTVVPTATNQISASATGVGLIISESPIAAVAGKIIFLARANLVGGTINVTVSSGTLTPASRTVYVIPLPSGTIREGWPMKSSVAAISLQPPLIFRFAGNHYTVPAWAYGKFNTIEIYDVQGKLLVRTSLKGRHTIRLSAWKKSENGVFVIRMLNRM